MSTDVVIGIDLGGTRIRAARLSADLKILQRIETLTLDGEGLDAVINRIVQQAQAVWPTYARVIGIGVSAPGPVDPIAGVLTTPPNLKGWHNVPLAKLLQDRLGAPAYLGNDANLAALAEHAMGAAKGYKHAVYITVSTGIGGGVIIDGHMFVGAHGLAAELGHVIMGIDGDRTVDWEYMASGTALARQAQAALEKGEDSLLMQMCDSIDAVNAKMVGAAAQAGDKLALRLVTRVGQVLGMGLVSILHTFDPEIVVMGGGVAKGTWPLIIDPMWDAIKKHCMDSAYWETLKIVQPILGEDVSLVGAGALALGKGS
ncbi:MAG: ROK family protein [Anaerolineae bacterium]|nr:ROK family protein [Anaerolineae bacterium]